MGLLFRISALTTPNAVASFTSSVNGLSVSFTDTSTGVPTSWLWNFGDGITSTVQNPSHVYAVDGNYNVVLSVTNITGNASSLSHTTSVASAAPAVTPTVLPTITGTSTVSGVIQNPSDAAGSTWRKPGVYDNNQFILSGAYKYIARSSNNGTSWTYEMCLPTVNSYNLVQVSPGTIVGIPYVATAAVSKYSAISHDSGHTWTNTGLLPASTVAFGNIAYTSGICVATTTSGTPSVIASTDFGTTWVQGTLTTPRSIVGGGGIFVAYNNMGYFATSVNGLVWTDRARLTAAIPLGNIIYTGDRFVYVDSTAIPRQSFDGVNWTALPGFGGAAGQYNCGFDNGVLVTMFYSATGTSTAWTTADFGTTWKTVNLPIPIKVNNIVLAGGGAAVIVGVAALNVPNYAVIK
jgi:PKD repeat protein